MQKKSVLFINDSLSGSSGVLRSLQQILRHISYEKFNVTLFICPGGTVEDAVFQSLPREVSVLIGSDRSHPYRHPSVAADYAAYSAAKRLHLERAAAKWDKRTRAAVHSVRYKRAARRYFGRRTFDVLVANTVPVCSELAQYVRADRKYAVFHSSRASFFPEATKAALSRFNGMVAVSEGVRQVLSETYPASSQKIRTITNYVDAALIKEMAAAAAFRPRRQAPVLCSCGRLSREKGFGLAVEAARMLRDRGYDFIWYFVGDGGERGKLADLIGQYGLSEKIEITGYLQNPYPYIAGCDIYVQPSFEEAQPMAVMEAQVLGRAIVSTDTVGGRTILENGKKGVLVPIRADALAEGISSLLEDPAKRASLSCAYTEEENRAALHSYVDAWTKLLNE